MAGTREKPEDIVLPLRHVEVLMGQGRSTADAVRQFGVTVQTYYRRRKERAMSASGPRTMGSAA